MRARQSLIAQWLEPLAAGLWIFFILWTLLIAFVWTLAIGDDALAHWIGNRDLRAALEWLIGIGDIAWFTLAATNAYLCTAENHGLRVARRWALIIGGSAMGLGTLSAWSGVPFGAIQYSQQLGVKIGPVPIGMPMLWFAIIISAREAALRMLPRASHAQIALASGFMVLVTDFNLEPVAAKLRGFWHWRAAQPGLPPLFTPPPVAFAAWFITAAALAFALREENVALDPRKRSLRPVVIFALVNAVFLAANAARFARR
jgi:uncharacterized membrane protein